ncbi:MAG: mechanosensitive ion channel, partial [Flavobacteriales bacterium]|nr:mechanosensitive ion channel [Flavobacteriales bacterium]
MNETITKVGTAISEAFHRSWSALVEKVPGILLAILIIAAGLLITRHITDLTRKVVSRRTQDPLMTSFLARTIKLVLSGIVIMIALRSAGLQGIATGLFAAAGASAIIVGFAFRDIGENFISGIILSFNRPFDLDDTVEIGEVFGKVTALEFRYTKLKTFDGRDVYIPNSDVIKKPVYNYTEDGHFRLDFVVGIAYEDVVEDATRLIERIVRSSKGVHEDATHEVFAVVDQLAVSTVNIKVHFWVDTKEYR